MPRKGKEKREEKEKDTMKKYKSTLMSRKE